MFSSIIRKEWNLPVLVCENFLLFSEEVEEVNIEFEFLEVLCVARIFIDYHRSTEQSIHDNEACR